MGKEKSYDKKIKIIKITKSYYKSNVNGKNPIIEHAYLGSSVEGKTCIVVDDMIH